MHQSVKIFMHDCLVAFRQSQKCRVTTLWFANPHRGALMLLHCLHSLFIFILYPSSSSSYFHHHFWLLRTAASQCRRSQIPQSHCCRTSSLARIQVRLMALVPLWHLPSFRFSQQIQRRDHNVNPKHRRRHENNGRPNERISINSTSLKTSPLGTS